MAPPTLTETINSMYVTTWQLRKAQIFDQIMNATPFYYLMNKKGKVKKVTGGRFIEEPLRYEKNETVKFIGKGESVALQATDNLTASYWNWKYLTGHIIIYFADVQKNRGKAALINKVNADIDTLRDSLIDKLETDLFGDGTGDGGKAIDGLGNIVSTTPTTGTVGGLNRATYTWWRNNTKDMTGEAVTTYLVKRMRTMFNDCGQLGEGVSRFPDIIVTEQNVYEAYEEETLEIGRILMGDEKMADLGFGELAFKGRPITWSPSCPTGNMYFLNTNFLHWTIDPIAYLTLGDFLPIIDQPKDTVAHSMSVCNLVCSNCKKQGVIYNISP